MHHPTGIALRVTVPPHQAIPEAEAELPQMAHVVAVPDLSAVLVNAAVSMAIAELGQTTAEPPAQTVYVEEALDLYAPQVNAAANMVIAAPAPITAVKTRSG